MQLTEGGLDRPGSDRDDRGTIRAELSPVVRRAVRRPQEGSRRSRISVVVRPSRRILLAGLAVLLSATAFGAQGSVPAGWQTQSETPLAPGVDHQVLTLADPAQSVHVAIVAPGAARLTVVSSHDAVAHQNTGGELPSDMCRRVGCLAGINADFHDPATGEPAGGVVAGGVLLRSPVPGRAQLIVTRDGHLQAGPLDWSGAVTASDGRTVAVGGVNVDPHPGDVDLYTPAWAGDTPDGADIELVLRATGAVGAIGATTALQIVGVRSDPGPIPADGAVLAASGSAAATLHALADMAAAGSISSTLHLDVRTAVDVVESVGGNPVVLAGGHPAFPDAGDSFTDGRHPRSLVGWNGAGDVVLVIVDGGRDGASGMTMAEAADLLTGLGATDGFGFDNSSATFVAGGGVQNLPVDDVAPGAPAPTEGREVGPGSMERPAVNALMVVPNAPAPTPGAGGGGSGSGSGAKSGPSTTPSTSSPRLTVAGNGSAPGTGGLAGTPAPSPGGAAVPSGTDIFGNPATKRRSVPTGSTTKGKKDKGGQPAAGGDVSLPDWNEIAAAVTPAVSDAPSGPAELSLAAGPATHHGRGHDPVRTGLELLAAGMIAGVLTGLRRVRDDRRPQRALWI